MENRIKKIMQLASAAYEQSSNTLEKSDPYAIDYDSDYYPDEQENVENADNLVEEEEKAEISLDDVGQEKTSVNEITRKKTLSVSKWRKNVIKSRSNSGKQYKHWKNNIVPERKIKPPCTGKCRLRCATKINEDRRNIIFKEYWTLADLTRQREFTCRFAKFKERKQTRMRNTETNQNSESRKHFSFVYCLPIGEESEKSRFIFCLYAYMAHKYNIQIYHKFLEKNHTQNEGDSVHSVIEKAARNIPMFTPSQWYTLVGTASRRKPYSVTELSLEDIYNLKDLLESTTVNWEKDTSKEKVRWTQVKVIHVDPTIPFVLQFKYTFSEKTFSINLLGKGRKKNKLDIVDKLKEL
ncbi:hypothetical protein ILUMI_10644 [Ignelater luminosus]|uniref:Uncharacterized protein n=1 Tax=Ignelater luminosus TaxID=2038154 RepID=A0A8K0GDZ2_IGNLU|nr:hypothetical protein ILUMI_10644 [Ignelater luminosus]